MRRKRDASGDVPAALLVSALPEWRDDLSQSSSVRVVRFDEWCAVFREWSAARAKWSEANSWPGGDDARIAEEMFVFPVSAPFDPASI